MSKASEKNSCSTQSPHLLFFDTFSHESSKVVQIDLVQFPKPVQVSEVRVIPLGARVRADFPGGVRLGATNPSQFEIEFFVNDLSKKGAATFENIGNLRYAQHGKICTEFSKKPSTDGLLLRGCYNTVTLAVYGNPTVLSHDSPPKNKTIAPRPPPEKVCAQERIRDWLQDNKQDSLSPIDDHDDFKDLDDENEITNVTSARKKVKGSLLSPVESSETTDQEDSVSSPPKPRKSKDEHNRKNKSADGLEDFAEDDDVIFVEKSRKSFGWEDGSCKGKNDEKLINNKSKSLGESASSIVIDDDEQENITESLTQVPPPIIAGDIEAISDDEVILDSPVINEMDYEVTPNGDQAENNDILPGDSVENCEYEEIMSDEDDLPEYQFEEDYIVEDWENWIKPFDSINQFEVPNLAYIKSPALSTYQIEIETAAISYPRGKAEVEKLNLCNKLSQLVSQTFQLEEFGGSDREIPSEIGENFVHVLEDVRSLIPVGLAWSSQLTETIETLSNWVCYGLNMDIAKHQQQPVYKIRHVKAGIRLCSSLFQCSSQVSKALLEKSVLPQLFSLLQQPYFALSLKLLVLNSIDSLISTSYGLRFMVNERVIGDKNGYELLLGLAASLQQSRAKVSVEVIIRKIHFLEVCEKLRSDVERLVRFDSKLISQDKNTFRDQVMLEDKSTELENSKSFNSDKNSENCNEILISISSGLEEVLQIYSHAHPFFVQFNKWLPGSKIFQLPKNKESPYGLIYNVFDMSGLLEALAVLLTLRSFTHNYITLDLVKSLLSHLLSTEHGLRYLASHSSTASDIIKALFKFTPIRQEYGHEGESLSELGQRMSIYLHVVHHLDSIAFINVELHRKRGIRQTQDSPKSDRGKEVFEPECEISILHLNAIVSLLSSAIGKEAVVSVVGSPGFTEILFPYITFPAYWQEEKDCVSKESACFGYAVDIFLQVIKYRDDVKYLEFYTDVLSRYLISWESIIPSLVDSTKLNEIVSWLALAKNPEIFNYDNFLSLSNIVQESVEKLEKFPGELLLTLRILCHLAIPQVSFARARVEPKIDGISEELKYKYAVMQLFSFDLCSHLLNILTKLYSIYEQPFMHGSEFVGIEGGHVLIVLKPALALLDSILDSVIQARNVEFRDLSAVVPLIQTYILLEAFPTSSPSYKGAKKLKKSVITSLLRFTQVIYVHEGEDVLSKSLWTQMMTEVFKFTLNAPHSIVSVLNLITELLPLPLPVESCIPLTDEECGQVVRLRKLWSAHLYTLAPMIQEVIHRLGLTSFTTICHSLRRMCVSLSDLSAPMALLVAKAILDLILQAHRLDQKIADKEENKESQKEESKPLQQPSNNPPLASSQTLRVLNMLSSLVTHAPTKHAVLHLLGGGSLTLPSLPLKSEEKYASLVNIWKNYLSISSPPGKATTTQLHLSSQETVLAILVSLIDHRNSLQCRNEPEASFDETTILKGVPQKEILVPFIESVMEVIGTPSCSGAMMQLSFQFILLITEHDYGFHFLRNILDKRKGHLTPLLRYTTSAFENEDENRLEILEMFLALCGGALVAGRNCSSSVPDLFSYFGRRVEFPEAKSEAGLVVQEAKNGDAKVQCSPEDLEEKNESLSKFKYLMTLLEADCDGEEEYTEYLYEEFNEFYCYLESNLATLPLLPSEKESPPEPPTSQSLQSQFGSRVLWVHPQRQNCSSYSFWFSPSSEKQSTSTVSVNMQEMADTYIGGDFSLSVSLNKLLNGQTSISTPSSGGVKMVQKYRASEAAIRPDKKGKAYVAPLRGGRPFVRGMVTRSDPFRSRPPNTSRPPSLHVDDFVALESSGHQPTGPTGYNKLPFGRGKMMMDSMRGRPRGRGELRGRFFHRLPFRGDGARINLGRGMGVRRGAPGWIIRGDGLTRPAFRGNPSGQRFMRPRLPFLRAGHAGIHTKFVERGRRDLAGPRPMRGFPNQPYHT